MKQKWLILTLFFALTGCINTYGVNWYFTNGTPFSMSITAKYGKHPTFGGTCNQTITQTVAPFNFFARNLTHCSLLEVNVTVTLSNGQQIVGRKTYNNSDKFGMVVIRLTNNNTTVSIGDILELGSPIFTGYIWLINLTGFNVNYTMTRTGACSTLRGPTAANTNQRRTLEFVCNLSSIRDLSAVVNGTNIPFRNSYTSSGLGDHNGFFIMRPSPINPTSFELIGPFKD